MHRSSDSWYQTAMYLGNYGISLASLSQMGQTLVVQDWFWTRTGQAVDSTWEALLKTLPICYMASLYIHELFKFYLIQRETYFIWLYVSSREHYWSKAPNRNIGSIYLETNMENFKWNSINTRVPPFHPELWSPWPVCFLLFVSSPCYFEAFHQTHCNWYKKSLEKRKKSHWQRVPYIWGQEKTNKNNQNKPNSLTSVIRIIRPSSK